MRVWVYKVSWVEGEIIISVLGYGVDFKFNLK